MLNLEIHNNSENNASDIKVESYVTSHTEYINYNKYTDTVSTMIGFVESKPQTPNKNLFIKDLSWKHPRNNVNYILEYEDSKSNLVFKIPYKEIRITNITNNSSPLYFKHKRKFKKDSNISLTIKKSRGFLEGESIETNGWKVVNQYVYNNYENKFDYLTGSYELYFISGVDENDQPVNELLSNIDSIGELSWKDIDPDTGRVLESGYSRNQIGSYFEFNISLSEDESCNIETNVLYVQTKEKNIIKLLPPDNFDMENSWNIKVQNGFFFKNKVYKISEFDDQNFNPEYGVIKLYNKRCFLVGSNNNSHIIKLPVKNINYDPNANSNIDIIIKDINDKVLFGISSNTTKIGKKIEDSIVLFESGIKSVDEKGGLIEITKSIPTNSKVYCIFHQKTTNYTIKDLNLNPINNKKILEGTYYFYLKPNIDRYEKSIEWLYIDKNNIIKNCSEKSLLVEIKNANNEKVYNPNSIIGKNLKFFKINYCYGFVDDDGNSNFKQYLELGEVSYKETDYLDELNIINIKDNTPVYEPNYTFMINRQWKILQSKFGYGEDGQVYQDNNIIYIQIMKNFLKQFGGNYTEDELYNLLKMKLFPGTELILDFNYYDLNIKLYNNLLNKIKVELDWEGPGLYTLIRRNTNKENADIILLDNIELNEQPENNLIVYNDEIEDSTVEIVHYFYRYKEEKSAINSIKIRRS